MTCRSCGAQIDAKAIICYRCGAPTADAAALRPHPASRRVPVALIIMAIVVALAIVAYFAWRPGGVG